MNDLRDVQYSPGQPLTIPTKDFTPDVQSAIIDSYFNQGGGGVYAGAASQLMEPQQQQAYAPQQQAPTQEFANSEIEELRNIKRMIDSNPDLLKVYARTQMGQPQPNAQYVQSPAVGSEAAATNNQPQNERTDPWASLFMDDTTKNETPAVKPEQQQQSTPNGTNDFVAGIIEESVKNGFNHQEVAEFVGSLKPNDFVMLYKAIREQQTQSQPSSNSEASVQQHQFQQPVNLAEASKPQSIRTLASPVYGGQRNSYWQ